MPYCDSTSDSAQHCGYGAVRAGEVLYEASKPVSVDATFIATWEMS
jgi:hypothetical protein